MRIRHDAFTLLELIVVIAIIAVVAAMVFAAYGTAKSMQQQTESAWSPRPWGGALGSYVAQNGGALPRRGQGVQPVTQLDRPEDWFNALPPLLGLPGYGELLKIGRRPRESDASIFIRPGATDPGGPVFL